MNKAVYAGSFDPFTNGHLDILKKASKLFDEVHLLIGVNQNKQRRYHQMYMKDAIENVIKNEHLDNCKVFIVDTLIAEYCKKNGIKYYVRGLRNSMDYNYEENICEANKLINPDMETVYFRAENVAISSSMVKELYSYGQDVSKYVPKEILPVLRTF
jgi:pantetheine-phosphate adenylyltransferase